MNYQKIYNQIILRAQERSSSKKEANLVLGYSEAHHIIPKCLGGTDEPDNIAYLSASEHFIAHQLLVKIYPENNKLKYALSMLCCSSKHNSERKMTNKMYSWIRRELGKAMSGTVEEGNERAIKISNSLSGRTKENDPSKRAAAAKMTGRTKENDEGYAKVSKAVSMTLSGRTGEEFSYIREAGKKRGELFRGRTKETHVGQQKQSDAISGKNHPSACQWKLESPNGEVIMTDELIKFCYDNDIHYNALRQTLQLLKDGTVSKKKLDKTKGWKVIQRIPIGTTAKRHDISNVPNAEQHANVGRTKDTHEYLKENGQKISQSKTKYGLDIGIVIVKNRDNGMTYPQIKKLISELFDVHIALSSFPSLYKKYENQIPN